MSLSKRFTTIVHFRRITILIHLACCRVDGIICAHYTPSPRSRVNICWIKRGAVLIWFCRYWALINLNIVHVVVIMVSGLLRYLYLVMINLLIDTALFCSLMVRIWGASGNWLRICGDPHIIDTCRRCQIIIDTVTYWGRNWMMTLLVQISIIVHWTTWG